jgi:hypothetical protein
MSSVQQQCSSGCYDAIINQVGQQTCAMVPEYCMGLMQQCVSGCIDAGPQACVSQYDYCMEGCD